MDTIHDDQELEKVSNTLEPQKLSDDSSEEDIKVKHQDNQLKDNDNIIDEEDKLKDDDDDDDEKRTSNEGHCKDVVATHDQQDCHEEIALNKEINETSTDDEAGQFEDVIVPEDEEIDEIIVPDEAEAEDLTDDKEEKDDNKSFVNAEEVETTKDSEIEEDNERNPLLRESEESTKSSSVDEIYEIDEKSDKESIYGEQQDESSKDSEDEDNDSLSAEPELVAIEDDGMKEALTCPLNDNTNDEQNLDEDSNKNSIDDPLDCIDNQGKNDEKRNNITPHSLTNKSDDKDDEDDEVQFIEIRNSPICIESDEDDTIEKNVKSTDLTPAKATITVPKNIIVTRTSARKSTSKSQQQQQKHTNINKSPTTVPQLQNKSKTFSYLQDATNNKRFSVIASTQNIVDCIDLLDSSDEESKSSNYNRSIQQKQIKTPQKRTLLAAKGNYYKSYSKNTADKSNSVPNNFSYNVRQQVKKPAPPPLPPPTPQSNFLNAVQLQPSAITGINPPSFSALLSNKNVIIPNAFYGNPPSVRASADTDIDRRYARWLENFLSQFCKPQFVPTHSCYVFLQKALKYKDFIRIKILRSKMNIHDTRDQFNSELMTELRTILLRNTKQITNYGRRFCELACSSVQGKALSLMTHSVTGKITLKTCNMEAPKISSATSSSNVSSNSLTRKRQLDEDEDEYTPDKAKPRSKAKPPSENGDRDSGENSEDRKRSLRTKRTKRLDNSFSYNEDDLLAEYEIDDEEEAEKLAQAEIRRKIEKKRLEAQKQRQQQVKSFESAFIQAFAKSIDGPTSSATAQNLTNQRIRLKNTTVATSPSIRQYEVNNDAEDLLQATWIENVENEDTQIISDDDEPKEHRIYKQQKQQQQLQIQLQQQQNYQTTIKSSNKSSNISPSPRSNKLQKRHQEETITSDNQYYNENKDLLIPPVNWPKNIDPYMHVNGKNKDKCIICHLSCQRLVHHYVNEHRGCEVYNSRISSSQIKLLRQGNYSASNVSLYKNGQFQYEAYCVFCEKESRFMLPYWYQHFTMHTGEYAYRCTGCGIRKPTRSLLTQHHAQGCPENGSVAQDYVHDSKTMQIEARICTLCNYVQLHRNNIVKHLHQQHSIKQILPKHIQTIVLLKISATISPSTSSTISSSTVQTNRNYYNRSSSYDHDTYIIDDDDTEVENEAILNDAPTEETSYNSDNHYYNYIPPYMQAAVNSGNFSFENVDAGDDLSFMICGMLDVQMNPE